MTTALIYDPIFLEHKTPARHPERPLRVEMAYKFIEALGWLNREGLVQLAPRAATLDELAAVHDLEYIQEVATASQRAAQQEVASGRQTLFFATDTYVSAKTYEAAIKAAGAPLTAIDALMKGEIHNAYCLVRPPGHHALPETAMGFCLFNNIAVAARYALDRYGLERVMIIDYDVHHGNGTQEMFYEDPRVLFFSVHQAPFYPGTGMSDERGEGAGLGTTVNVPLPAGCGFETYEPIFRQFLAPLADRFQPQLILVSAGFDAHWKDHESGTKLLAPDMKLSTAGFARLNQIIIDIAKAQCDGRLILVQEGGYHAEAMASCVATCVNLLLGDDAAVDSLGPPPQMPEYRINMDVLIAELRRLHGLTGYRMRNAPKPDRAKLLREMKGPDSTT
ncbi:MAG: histone deacetylase [Ktedonobacteraceae bacterium]|nr:histone deacetylase [Ktedonobacteraceae bacterium]